MNQQIEKFKALVKELKVIKNNAQKRLVEIYYNDYVSFIELSSKFSDSYSKEEFNNPSFETLRHLGGIYDQKTNVLFVYSALSQMFEILDEEKRFKEYSSGIESGYNVLSQEIKDDLNPIISAYFDLPDDKKNIPDDKRIKSDALLYIDATVFVIMAHDPKLKARYDNLQKTIANSRELLSELIFIRIYQEITTMPIISVNIALKYWLNHGIDEELMAISIMNKTGFNEEQSFGGKLK
jgi:hypothetical protein